MSGLNARYRMPVSTQSGANFRTEGVKVALCFSYGFRRVVAEAVFAHPPKLGVDKALGNTRYSEPLIKRGDQGIHVQAEIRVNVDDRSRSFQQSFVRPRPSAAEIVDAQRRSPRA